MTFTRFLPFRVGLLAMCAVSLSAAIVPVGQGSYTTTFPGTDVAGRNGTPPGTAQLSGNAAGKPIPTNDWWSALLQQNHAANLFNYPMAMRTLPTGLDLGWIVPGEGPTGSAQPLSDISPIVVGVEGLNATRATVDDYSDWTVTIGWDSGAHRLRATTGLGMPFVYFKKAADDVVAVKVNVGNASVAGEILLIENSQGGSNFAVYAPSGSTWVASGDTYTSTLAGKDYWSIAFLPPELDAETAALAWQDHAHVVPTDTRVAWAYDENSATVRTTYTTSVDVLEGSGTSVLQGLLPHQWSHLAADAPALSGQSLGSIRGELKLLAANQFATEDLFHGILPTLPAAVARSDSYDPAQLHAKIDQLKNDSLATWTDSYNEGQVMNRLVQTARIAHEIGNDAARDAMLATIRERLEDWLTAENGEVAFLFHYDADWTALLGYPAGHGQDTNLNDHHFHWGYFIHAAAFIAQFDATWGEQWGPMVDLLVRDAASPDRDDPLFPFLRSFSPFAGHSWANGFASFPFGNDQESSSESMQFASSLIHWGAVRGDAQIRDLGVYLYTTEKSAIEDYWFDIHDRTFKPGYNYALASRIWGNGYDNQTFWTGDIAAAYGIELYPIHAGSLYLAHDPTYAQRLWDEMAANTGILSNAANDNLWHDVYWKFLAMLDPGAALDLYESYPNRSLKFGISDAQTYYWLHAFDALGQIVPEITADDPLAVVFDLDGEKTYSAHNYRDVSHTVTFSDGTTLTVPPHTLATSRDLAVSGMIETPFGIAPTGNTIRLEVALDGDASGVTQVDIVEGTQTLAVLNQAPFAWQTPPLSAGRHSYYARLHVGDESVLTGVSTVVVGEQMAFGGVPWAIPGTIEAGHFDSFEGGSGQGVSYHDSTLENSGDYRPGESVDADMDAVEGATVGWISGGEWLEYTVEVETSANYRVEVHYACDNDAGGGPFHFELDGQRVSPDTAVTSTGDWSTYQPLAIDDVPITEGVHVLRLAFGGGELNVGRLVFTELGSIDPVPPVVSAGVDQILAPPGESVTLDGAVSGDGALTVEWTQVFGPVAVIFDDATSLQPTLDGLTENGLYRFRLTVFDGTAMASDEVEVMRGTAENRAPTTSILSPSTGAQVLAGQPLEILVSAHDSDGEITSVSLFNGTILLGTDTTAPFSFQWSPPLGSHSLSTRAIDDEGSATDSSVVTLSAIPPAPCTADSASGDFSYTFSADANNPTLTFTPSRAGVGDNIVLLYYGVGGGPYPGYLMTPGVPLQLNATQGQTIGFYFTYSVPEGGERNTLSENSQYTIGTCAETSDPDPALAFLDWQSSYFTTTELADGSLEDTLWGETADPDQDGLSNWLEFLTGEDPRADSPAPLVIWTGQSSAPWTVRFALHASVTLDAVELAWSSDLEVWATGTWVFQEISLEGDYVIYEARLDPAPNASEPGFIRLRPGS